MYTLLQVKQLFSLIYCAVIYTICTKNAVFYNENVEKIYNISQDSA